VASSPFDGLARATVNGAALAWRERGTGAPIVLVHGGASDVRTWDGQIERLSGAHRVVAYSRRYARPNAPIDPDADDPLLPHVEDLVALARQVGAVPAHLVGHSWGGLVCLLAAMRHPELVRTLVLMEAPALTLFVSMPPRPAELLRLLAARPRTALTILAFGVRAVEPARRAFRRGDLDAGLRAFGRGVLGPRAFERLSPERLRQARENVAADRAQPLGAGSPPLEASAVRRVQAPTLLLTGAASPPLFRLLAEGLRERLPRAQRVEIAGASHLLHEDAPEATSAAILAFLARHAAAGP
jgi:pimeloyl-ACP methyl ester carboxylesterase